MKREEYLDKCDVDGVAFFAELRDAQNAPIYVVDAADKTGARSLCKIAYIGIGAPVLSPQHAVDVVRGLINFVAENDPTHNRLAMIEEFIQTGYQISTARHGIDQKGG